MSTINQYKEAASGAQPVYLFDFTWADGSTLSVCSHALTYGGTAYLARVMQQQIDPIQALSPHGIEIPGSVKLTLADADKDLYQIEASKGFRGARLKVTFAFYDFVAAAWSSDSMVPFVGRCDRPEVNDDSLVVTASFILNLEAKNLPAFVMQPRCPKPIPATAAQKALADTPGSMYYACGVTDPTKTTCTYDKAGCAANNNSLRFGGITWEVPPASRSREYTTGNWLTDLQSDLNAAKYGDYAPIGYGTAWVDCLVLGSWPEANSTRGEAIVCEGRPESILKVVVDDEELPPATDLDGNQMRVADPLFRYNVISTGDRTGALNQDAPWNGNGDPHGSLCVIEWVVYHKLTSAMPRVRALVKFPKVRAYAKIASITGGVATLANNAPNADIAGNSPYTVRIFGCSNGALNGTFGLTSWAYGPPGTVTLAGTSASGTGGYIEYLASSDTYAWAMLDVLQRAGLALADVALDWWVDAALKHAKTVSYTARDGSTKTHAKYTCSVVVRQRRPVADLLTGMLRGCASHLGRDLATGAIAIFARGSIAEQQPAAVDGSNYGAAIAGGHVAYHFDESSMVRDGSRLTRPGRAAGSVPNVVTVPFGNEENDYSGDSVAVKDADDINLMGQEISGNFAVEGCNALDRANRVGAIFLAEQLGGEAWRWTSSAKGVRLSVGQIVAVSNVKHDHALQLMRLQQIAPAENYETCTYDATIHDDAWYADAFDAVTGNPATAARRNRLVRPSWPWRPYQVQPAAGDPLYARTEWTFGLQLVYNTMRDGAAAPVATITGMLPVNEPANLQPPVLAKQGTTASVGGTLAGSGRVYFVAVASRDANGRPGPVSAPCVVVVAQGGSTNTITAAVSYWDPAGSGYFVFVGLTANTLSATNDAGYAGTPATVTVTDLPAATWDPPDTEFDRLLVRPKYVWHAGVFGAAVTAVGVRAITIAGAGWTTNQWAGYDCTVLAKADLSVLPVVNFRVASTTATVLTIDGASPDPNALGVAAGDVLVMLSRPTVAGLTLTDANWQNTLSNGGAGLAVHVEAGRILRVIAGTGRGYTYAIDDNTATAITITGPWVVAPDSTSRYVIEDAAGLPESADSTPVSNADQTSAIALSLPVRNYAGATLLIEAATADGGGNESAANCNPVRLVYVGGAAGVLPPGVLVPSSPTTGTPLLPTGVVGAEVGPVITDLTDQLQHTKLRVSATVPAGAGGTAMSVWRSTDGAGAWYQAVAVIPFSGTAFSTAGIGDVDTLVKGATVSCKFAIALGFAAANGGLIPAASLPENAVLSNAFNMAAIAAPSPTGASGLSWTAPVYAGVNSNGDPYWTSTLTGNLPGVNDPSWFLTVTVECVDASGNSDPGPDSNTLPASGTVDIVGNNVTWRSGERFNPSLVNANLGINIQGRHYVVDTYTDSEHLVIHTAHGNLTGASYWTLGGEHLRGEWVNGPGGKLIEVNGTSATMTGSYNPSGSPYVYLRSHAWLTNRRTTVAPGWKDPDPTITVFQTTGWVGGVDHQTIYFGDAPGKYSGMAAVVNPGFEQDLNGWQSFAELGAGHPSVVGSGVTAPHSGNYCLQCGQSVLCGAMQFLPCSPGQTITMSAWLKSVGSPADLAYVEMTFHDSLGAQISGHPVTTSATATWTQVFVVAVVPNGAVTVRLQVFRNWSTGITGYWYFDDVQVSSVGSSDATVRYNPNAVASSDGFQPGANTTPVTNNPSTSILLDWDFSLSRLGAIPRIGGSQWAPLGDAQILNDADGNGNYCRLTGPNAEIMQTRGITAGQAFYFSCQMRSNSATGTHNCTMYVTWLDGSNAVIGSRAAIGTATGSIPAWGQGMAGWATAPAKAAFAFVEFAAAETAGNGGHWDIGKVIVQATMNQSAGAQTQTNVPAAGSGDQTALATTSTANRSKFAPDYFIIGNQAGNIFILGSANAGGTGTAYFQVAQNGGANPAGITFQVSAAGVVTVLIADGAGNMRTGYTGSVTGRNCVNGFVY